MKRRTATRFSDPIRHAIKPALKNALWLISIMVPVSFAVTLLQYWGILDYIAHALEPVCRLFGLRGEAALALVTAALMNIYSCIAVIQTIPFTAREICIIALMGLLAHNLIIETLVQMKTGSKGLRMIVVGGLFLNWTLPADDTVVIHGIASNHLPFLELMQNWLIGTLWLTFKLVCIVVSLNILQRILEEFGVMLLLARWATPLLRPMGLPANSAFLWIVAYIIGLGYGAAILIEHRKENKISAEDADLLNHHIALSHSLLEDTALYLAIGVGLGWITLPRIALAIIAVWVARKMRL
jgi:spore maturation protein SpmB